MEGIRLHHAIPGAIKPLNHFETPSLGKCCLHRASTVTQLLDFPEKVWPKRHHVGHTTSGPLENKPVAVFQYVRKDASNLDTTVIVSTAY
jgi:hypothetical protein